MDPAILITARLKSTRLPFKVMREIKGKPMLQHLIERLALARHPRGIVICTSTLAQDDALERLAEEVGVAVFRGDPDDVLQRLTDAAEHFRVKTVVSCTADNPFVDPEYTDRMLEFHWQQGSDYTRCQGLPWGAFCYVLQTSAMKRACRLKATTDTEVWGGYFTQTGAFVCRTFEVDDPAVLWPDLRLTVDTPADFQLASAIFDALHRPGEVFSLGEIVQLCRTRPELLALNADVIQASAPPIKIAAEIA